MKPIKITVANNSAIEAALACINGRATSHTYTTFAEIESVAEHFEARVTLLVGAQKNRVGALGQARSGGSTAKSYKYSRQCTRVSIERRSAGWYLTALECDTAWTDAAPPTLWMTLAQDMLAIEKLRTTYFGKKATFEQPTQIEA